MEIPSVVFATEEVKKTKTTTTTKNPNNNNNNKKTHKNNNKQTKNPRRMKRRTFFDGKSGQKFGKIKRSVKNISSTSSAVRCLAYRGCKFDLEACQPEFGLDDKAYGWSQKLKGFHFYATLNAALRANQIHDQDQQTKGNDSA